MQLEGKVKEIHYKREDLSWRNGPGERNGAFHELSKYSFCHIAPDKPQDFPVALFVKGYESGYVIVKNT